MHQKILNWAEENTYNYYLLGFNDCAMLVYHFVKDYYTIDLGFRAYSSAKDALAVYKDTGGLETLLEESGFRRNSVSNGAQGDIVVIPKVGKTIPGYGVLAGSGKYITSSRDNGTLIESLGSIEGPAYVMQYER
jgi:hypothetical protein